MPAEGEPEKADKAKEDQDPKNGELYMKADRLARDNQLRRALDLLKAWQVFEKVAFKQAETKLSGTPK